MPIREVPVPISPVELLGRLGLQVVGTVHWGTPPPSGEQGVYVVSIHSNPLRAFGIACPLLADSALVEWLETADELTLDGERPAVHALRQRIESYWLGDEAILYIGKATCLSQRVQSFYRSRIGRRSPHRGGMWLKTLSILDQLSIHWIPIEDHEPETVESDLLGAFVESVVDNELSGYPDADRHLPLPFANLEWAVDGRNLRRQHGISRPAV